MDYLYTIQCKNNKCSLSGAFILNSKYVDFFQQHNLVIGGDNRNSPKLIVNDSEIELCANDFVIKKYVLSSKSLTALKRKKFEIGFNPFTLNYYQFNDFDYTADDLADFEIELTDYDWGQLEHKIVTLQGFIDMVLKLEEGA